MFRHFERNRKYRFLSKKRYFLAKTKIKCITAEFIHENNEMLRHHQTHLGIRQISFEFLNYAIYYGLVQKHDSFLNN